MTKDYGPGLDTSLSSRAYETGDRLLSSEDGECYAIDRLTICWAVYGRNRNISESDQGFPEFRTWR